MGLAQTGSGKTGTFALPILQALLEHTQPFFALCLSPTRELAIQIAEQFDALGAGIGLKVVALVGGVDMMQQAVAVGKRPHVLVGTPGRVVDHIANTKGFSLKVRATSRPLAPHACTTACSIAGISAPGSTAVHRRAGFQKVCVNSRWCAAASARQLVTTSEDAVVMWQRHL